MPISSKFIWFKDKKTGKLFIAEEYEDENGWSIRRLQRGSYTNYNKVEFVSNIKIPEVE